MNFLQALLLGIIQGLTEFLPISSSGHLVLFQKILGVTEPAMTFDIVVHLGTLVAVFIAFWEDIWGLLKKPFQKLTYLLIVGTIPAVVIALAFNNVIENLFASGKTLGFEFLITGLVILYANSIKSGKKTAKDATYLDAIFVGVMQGIAIAPAISRSGMTIAGSLFKKFDRDFAAKFSFLLSIPAILGAAVFQLKDIVSEPTALASPHVMPLVVGFCASAISGYFAIHFMLKIIRESKLKYFSYYVFILGAAIIVDQFVTHMFF